MPEDKTLFGLEVRLAELGTLIRDQASNTNRTNGLIRSHAKELERLRAERAELEGLRSRLRSQYRVVLLSEYEYLMKQIDKNDEAQAFSVEETRKAVSKLKGIVAEVEFLKDTEKRLQDLLERKSAPVIQFRRST